MPTPSNPPSFETLEHARTAKDHFLRRVVELAPSLAWTGQGGGGASGAGSVPVVSGLGVGITRSPGDGYRLIVRPRYGRKGMSSAVQAAIDEFEPGLIDARTVVRPRLLNGNPGGPPWAGLEIGAPVAHYQDRKGFGTVGFFARDKENAKRVYLVSNTHVLKLGRWEVGGRPAGGHHDTAHPPAIFGGIDPRNRIGEVHDAAPLDVHKLNWIDAAVTVLDSPVATAVGRRFNAFPPGRPAAVRPGHVTGYNDAPQELVQFTPLDRSLWVHKRGAKTGWTSGIVSALEVDTDVPLAGAGGVLHFKNVIEVTGVDEDFAAPGDSGSCIVDNDGRVVGLVFAVTELYRPAGGPRVLAYAVPAGAIQIYFPYLVLR